MRLILACVLGSQKSFSQRKARYRQELSERTCWAEIESTETELRGMNEGRHRPFFDYAVLLARAGLGRDEIELKLEEIAGPERKMRKKIRGILKSLSKYGWFA